MREAEVEGRGRDGQGAEDVGNKLLCVAVGGGAVSGFTVVCFSLPQTAVYSWGGRVLQEEEKESEAENGDGSKMHEWGHGGKVRSLSQE